MMPDPRDVSRRLATPKRPWYVRWWKGMAKREWALVAALLAILCVVLALGGCAIPVRPIAKLAPGADGLPHFIPDPDQEPKVAPVVGGILNALLSPEGLGAGSGLVGLALAAVAAVRNASNKARADAEARRAEEHKADSDEGWRKADAYARALPSELPKV